MSEEKARLAEIGRTRPTFSKYITPDSVAKLLAKTDDRHICSDCSPYVVPGSTLYSLAELDDYVRRNKSHLSHDFGATERMVLHMYLAAVGKDQATDMLSREARAQAHWKDLSYMPAKFINELSESHDISPK